MEIRPYQDNHLAGVVSLWNGCVSRGEVLYRPLVPSYFEEKFRIPGAALFVALEKNAVIGFIAGCVKTQFLPGQTSANTPGYLSVLMVDPAHRGRGVGSALLHQLEARMRDLGKTLLAITSTCPINLDWIIPGTPGHEHNNMPGADLLCSGYGFLQRRGFAERVREVAMYLDLAEYRKSPEIEEKRAALAAQGIIAGLYDPALGSSFDGMCDRVGSEYWRQVLRDEIASAHPRPILAAVHEGNMVGFTGPVDRQENGRGWFTGICTDPLYEKRGIASVLFNDLMGEFIRVGAAYSTLFTGTENHAQRLYLKTGFRAARQFAIMHKQLEG
ncbi:MAG: GNAT family N-acetyltransferase [Clostridia bacterium]|nr:GNAT family N-acetyltransferase [Clostridia bacterium]